MCKMFFLLIATHFYFQSGIFLLSIKTCDPSGHFAPVAALAVLTNKLLPSLSHPVSLISFSLPQYLFSSLLYTPNITAFYIIWLQICQLKKKRGKEKRKRRQQFCQMINFCLLSMFNVIQGCKYVCLLDSKKNDRKFLTCNKSARLGLTKVQCYQDYQSICNDML